MKRFIYRAVSVLLILAIGITSFQVRAFALEKEPALALEETESGQGIDLPETKGEQQIEPEDPENKDSQEGTGLPENKEEASVETEEPEEKEREEDTSQPEDKEEVSVEAEGQEEKEKEDSTELPENAVEESILVEGQAVTREEFRKLLENITPEEAEIIPRARMAGVAAAYFVPGLGEVLLITTGVILIGGIVYEAGTWAHDEFMDWANSRNIQLTQEEEYEDAKEKGEPVPGRHGETHQDKDHDKDLPVHGQEPNSSQDLYDKDGNLKQRRYYDKNGDAEEDIDFKHGGGDKHEFPHRHIFNWKEEHARSKKPLPMNSSKYMNGSNAARLSVLDFFGLSFLADFLEANHILPPRRFDPVILDLDGNGIHILAKEDYSVFFDLDMDDFAEKTAWIDLGDGLLCMDSNGDGVINNNRELFGDQFILSNGKKSKHGFEALDQFDENNDGVIDQADEVYKELLVWQDWNKNGYSESRELSDLNTLEIHSLNLDYTSNTSGGQLLGEGTYTREDGNILSMNEYLLDVDPFYTLEEIHYYPTDRIASLPDLSGTGKVRSLHNAMMLDDSQELENLVASFTKETNPIKRRVIFQDILLKWTDSDNINSSSRGDNIDAKRLNVIEKFKGEEFVGTDGSGIPNTNAARILNNLYDQVFNYYYTQLYYNDRLNQMFFLSEEEVGDNPDEYSFDINQSIAYIEQLILEEPSAAKDLLTELTGCIKESQWNHRFDLTALTAHFQDDPVVYGKLGECSWDKIIIGTDDNDGLNGTNMSELLIGGPGTDTLRGENGNDTYYFERGFGIDTITDYDRTAGNQDAIEFGDDIFPQEVTASRSGNQLVLGLENGSDKLIISNYFDSPDYEVEKICFNDGTQWGRSKFDETTKVIKGTEKGDVLEGFQTDDAIDGLGGNDKISGLYGNDTLDGGTGNDIVNGGNGNDFLYGREGNDSLNGEAGNDVLDGETGDDTLNGGNGNDTYIYGAGYGIDTITDYGTTEDNQDILRFTEEITPQDVTGVREGDHLILSFLDPADRLILYYYFRSPEYVVEKIQFGDGTEWDKSRFDETVTAIKGTERNDSLSGYEMDDTIQGLGGDDTIKGNNGNDLLDGGPGNDLLYGGNGSDRLYGKEGNDQLHGEAGGDTLDGEAGEDTLNGGAGNDTYLFHRGYGKDTINDYDAAAGNEDKVLLGEGIKTEDITPSREGDRLILKINGTEDQLAINYYFHSPENVVEKICFEDGTEWDKSGFDQTVKAIKGTEGNDSLPGYETDDAIEGLGGDDTIKGNNGDDLLDGGPGNDLLYGGNGSDCLYGKEGNDRLYGEAGDDLLDGGSGRDALNGGAGNDLYLFGLGYGADTVEEYDTTTGNEDKIRFEEGIKPEQINASREGSHLVLKIKNTEDQLTIHNYFHSPKYVVEKIQFEDGTEWDKSRFDETVKAIKGTEGNDRLSGYETDDAIEGLGGDDTIQGNNGDDLLDGGLGNDQINGGNGRDRLYGKEGNDRLYGEAEDDALDGGSGRDTLNGGVGNDTYLFQRGYGKDVIDDYDTAAGNEDKVLFGEGIKPEEITATREGGHLVLKIKDTEDWLTIHDYFYSPGYVVEKIRFEDGTEWDKSRFDETVRAIKGTEGNDNLSGYEMDDTIEGLEGDDTIKGNNGDDLLDGGSGNDQIYGGSGSDCLYGKEGNDRLYGGAGDDTLDGRTGKDALNGGVGNDTYLFDRGYGADTIDDYDRTTGNQDKVLFGEDIKPEEAAVSREGSHLVFTIHNTGDRLTIYNYFISPEYVVEKIQFEDGTEWDESKFHETVKTIKGTEENDLLSGYETDDTIEGYGGDDTINGNNGEDLLDGGPGNDRINGGNGNDSLYGKEGNDRLYGETGNDTLDGGAGRDILNGGVGNDTYLFGLGYGTDTIEEYDPTAGNEDTVLLGEGIKPEEVAVFRSGSHLVLKISTTEDRLTLNNYFTYPEYVVERIRFGDGTEWDKSRFHETVKAIKGTEGNDSLSGYETDDTIEGLGGDDSIRGYNGDDLLDGGAGNDQIYGGSGSDRLYGKEGNDRLYGEAENDTYLFDRGYGMDTIEDYDPTAGNEDTVLLGEGIKPEEAAISREGGHLVFTIHNTEDQLTISNYFRSPAYLVEKIRFADGTEWNKAYVEERILTPEVINGTNSDDSIMGTAQNETINGLDGMDQLYGLDGNDGLYGGYGDDVLDGGKGNDSLEGGYGSDIYIYGKDYGTDTICMDSRDSAKDILRFKDQIKPDNVSCSREINNLIVSLSAQEKVVIKDYFTNYKLSKVEFEDGTTWGQEFFLSKADKINGTNKNEALLGSNEDDVIMAYDGDDQVNARAGKDTVYGGNGNDAIYGEDGNDTLYGENGNDNLYGGSGDDILDGGIGTDTMDGGTGNDTYLIERNTGIKTIRDYDTAAVNMDTLKFAGGIKPEEVSSERSGNSLILYVNRGKGKFDTKILITDYFVIPKGYGADCYHNLVEKVEFEDGTIWEKDYFTDRVKNINGTEDDETITAFATDDIIKALDGDDRVIAEAGNDMVYGGNGNDTIYGEDGNDTLYGEAGNDNLYGGSGDDILDGGMGTDAMEGGMGNDTYLIERKTGTKTVWDYDTAAANMDTLKFVGGIKPEEVSFERSGNSLILYVNRGKDKFDTKVMITDYFVKTKVYGTDRYHSLVEKVAFEDGTIWEKDYFTVHVKNINGTENDDVITAFSTEDVIKGLDGDDRVNAGTGNDKVYGGNGNDTLYGEDGNDALYGEAGNDTLYGGSGDDVLDGGTGTDTLYGETGSDTYRIHKRMGEKSISDYDTSAVNVDVIKFTEGIQPVEVDMERSGDNLILYVNKERNQYSTKVVISNYFRETKMYGVSYYNNLIEKIEFEDGTAWSYGHFMENAKTINGTDDDDTIEGFSTDDRIMAYGGDDRVSARAGNDTVYGGNGNDTLYGEDGNDILHGENGNDTLYGGNGDDVLEGGNGTDILIGETGNDSYLINKETGIKTITDSDAAAGNQDTLKFTGGIRPEEVSFERSGNNLILYINRIKGRFDTKVIITDYFVITKIYGVNRYYNLVEKAEFEDGTMWDMNYFEDHTKNINGTGDDDSITAFDTDDTVMAYAGDDQINARAGNDTVYGGNGNDAIYGENGNDTLYGEDGNDTLYGGNGDDVLDGGTGTDNMDGGTGSDTYIFPTGSGIKNIIDFDSGQDDKDTVQIIGTIKQSDFVFHVNNNDLILTFISNPGDKIIVKSYFSRGCRIERFKINDKIFFVDLGLVEILN